MTQRKPCVLVESVREGGSRRCHCGSCGIRRVGPGQAGGAMLKAAREDWPTTAPGRHTLSENIMLKSRHLCHCQRVMPGSDR